MLQHFIGILHLLDTLHFERSSLKRLLAISNDLFLYLWAKVVLWFLKELMAAVIFQAFNIKISGIFGSSWCSFRLVCLGFLSLCPNINSSGYLVNSLFWGAWIDVDFFNKCPELPSILLMFAFSTFPVPASHHWDRVCHLAA